jgi:DNA primase
MINQLVTNLVNSILGHGKPTARGNQAYTCPFCHHHKPKLEINLDENATHYQKWHCWACNKKGSKLLSLFKAIDASIDKIEELKSLVGSGFRIITQEFKTDLKLPEEFKSLSEITENDIVGRHALAYLKKRGVSKHDILKYNVGYCEGGAFDKMVVIPSYNNEGKLNYYVARNFNLNSKVKYKNPALSKNIIPFELYINWSSPIVLCEGMFDAMAIKRNAIPLLGKHIQDSLMKKIVTSTVKQVYIALDKDAMKDALRFAELLINEGKEVYLVDLDEKDPSEMGFTHFTNLIQNTKQLTQYSLMAKKLELI